MSCSWCQRLPKLISLKYTTIFSAGFTDVKDLSIVTIVDLNVRNIFLKTLSRRVTHQTIHGLLLFPHIGEFENVEIKHSAYFQW